MGFDSQSGGQGRAGQDMQEEDMSKTTASASADASANTEEVYLKAEGGTHVCL
jgi:hypothetical protein